MAKSKKVAPKPALNKPVVKSSFMCVDKLPQNNQKVIIEVDGRRQKSKFQLGKFNIGMGQFREPITQIEWWAR